MRLLRRCLGRIDLIQRRGGRNPRFLDRSWGNAAAPSIPAVLIALKACSIAKEIQSGRKIHWNSTGSGIASSIFVANALVNMYSKCGSILEARQVFEGMKERDSISWNALIQGYATNGGDDQALELFFQARDLGLADARTCVFALMACSSMADRESRSMIDGKFLKVNSLHWGMTIDAQVRELRCDADIFVAGALVDMYSKCGSMESARSVFDAMVNPDVVAWTALILGYAENDQGMIALELFQRMQREGCDPNARTFVAALVACVALTPRQGSQAMAVKARCLEIGRELHSQAVKRRVDSELFVASSLIDMYCKCGSVEEAWKIFSGMTRHDVVSWTTMIVGFAENGQGRKCLELFELMQARRCSPNAQTYLAVLLGLQSSVTEERSDADAKLMKIECLEKVMKIHSRTLQSDIFMENVVLDLYGKCGSMLDARLVFDKMRYHNVITWTALIHGYAEDGQNEVAFEMFAAMKSRVAGSIPDAQLYVAVLVACSNATDLEMGSFVHGEICKHGHDSNEFVANCLIDFYGRCGRVDKAEHLFESMTTKDLVSWSSLLAGFSRLGDTARVFQLFSGMREAGIQAGPVTFLSMLSACGHAGLVEKGKKWFESMDSKYGVKPGIEHYHCMIDLLGRASYLEEALAMAETMPFEANVVTWTTVLGACEKWKNVELGERAFRSLLQIDEKLAAAYSLMANLYRNAGMLQEQENVERAARSRCGGPSEKIAAFVRS